MVSEHALMRWQEYVCPLREPWWACGLMENVVGLVGELAAARPDWLGPDTGEQPDATYLVAGDFAFVVVPLGRDPGLIVVTVIPRGSIPRNLRRARNEAAARRRAVRAARRRERPSSRARRRELLAPGIDRSEG